jgi:dihydroorotase
MNKNIKTLQALCATSNYLERMDITFDSENCLILKVSPAVLKAHQVDYFYGDDCLLFAAMGDIHIHAREDVSQKNCYKEDFISTSQAAINGGVLHVADMPNNPIPPIDDSSYLNKLSLVEKSEVPILLYAGIGPETRALSFKVPYKAYMGPSIGDLFFKDNASLDRVLEHYRGEMVSFHCEDPEILEEHKHESTHECKRPVKAEVVATKTALALIEKYQLRGKLCHYSSGEGLELIKAAKKKGLSVTCEVTPQHLYYSLDELKALSHEDKTLFQMNPPIREKSDQERLLTAFKEGIIDYLATDHAPHDDQEKKRGTSGMPGLDTYGPFVTWLIVDQKIDPKIVAKAVSEKPGDFFNEFLGVMSKHSHVFQDYGLGLGHLKPGYSASFTILNLKSPLKIEKHNLKTKASWSPFLGVQFPGRVEALFLKGRFLSVN